MFSYFTDRLAERQARREQKKHERQKADEQEKFERSAHELGLIAYKVLVENIHECCIEKREFEKELCKEGAHVRLRSRLTPQRKKETEIEVSSARMGLTVINVFSSKALCTYRTVRTI